MRRLVVAIAIVVASTTVRADDAQVESQKRVEAEAARVWSAFADGVVPSPEVGREAQRVLEAHVRALPLAQRASARLHSDEVDVLLAKAAWAAGDRAAARARAERVLDALTRRRRDWDTGNILHEMHILLGRVALESGCLEQADLHPLRASKTQGSPQLDSFGPDWTLARDLLDRGHREAVSAYVLRVGAFWESGRDRLAEWKRTLARGGTPKFLPERKRTRKEDGARRPHGEFGAPAALATPCDGLLGFWESTAKSKSGFGDALRFRPDGAAVAYVLILVDCEYRVSGDEITLPDGTGGDMTVPVGTFEGETWKFGAVVKKRVGAATAGLPAFVGVWTYDFFGPGVQAFERFDEDGWMRFRMRMPVPPTAGTYELDGDRLTMAFGGKPETRKMTIQADRLRLASAGETREYRYVGTRAWYMPATGDG